MTEGIFKVMRRDTDVMKFVVHDETSDINSIKEVFKKNSYQRKDFQIGTGERWLDGGANIGAFSVYMGAKGNMVKPIEADRKNYEQCLENLEINGSKIIDAVYAALMPDTYDGETVRFYVSDRPMAKRRHNVFGFKKQFTTVDVPVIKWSDAIHGVDCVKLNIEGVEIELLESVDDFSGINKLVFEYSWDKDPSIKRFLGLIEKLKTHFSYVDYNKKVDPAKVKWEYYPPNIFVYCMK